MMDEEFSDNDQQRVYRTVSAIAASGCTEDGDWLQLFGTGPTQALGRNLTQLLRRIRQRQQAQLVSPAPHDRLLDVRGLMEAEGLDALIIGHDDENLNEYVTPQGERLQWLTGFRGSAGSLLVLHDAAFLFVDGRYSLQAPQQVDPHFVTVLASNPNCIAAKIVELMPKGDDWQVGVDARLFTMASYRRLQKQLRVIDALLVDVTQNPIDFLWKEQPPAPLSPIAEVENAGLGRLDKLKDVCAVLQDKHCDCLVVQAPEDVIWLLNIRGKDIDTAPLFLSKMIVHAEGSVDWFLTEEKCAELEKLGDMEQVFLHPEAHFLSALDMLGQAESNVWVDPARTSAQLVQALSNSGATLHEGQDPIWQMAACLNDVEMAGMRAAHMRDGCALVEFMADIAANPEPCQESDLVVKLQQFRQNQQGYQQDSFHAIVAAKGNAAQCHYRPIPDADDRVRWGDLVLIDSGGHYDDGTTDVTRVIAYDQGDVPVSSEFKKHYTLVLQSLIAISEARFPVGTTGMSLDAIARVNLWAQGLDYDHGTGHGVGSNSMVHFGPQRIAKAGSTEPLREGMVISLEPGLYFAHRYGIRLENLAIVVADPDREGWLKFDNITWVPFVPRMIDTTLLTEAELAWLNDYHGTVYRKLARNLKPKIAEWLASVTAEV